MVDCLETKMPASHLVSPVVELGCCLEKDQSSPQHERGQQKIPSEGSLVLSALEGTLVRLIIPSGVPLLCSYLFSFLTLEVCWQNCSRSRLHGASERENAKGRG